MNHRMIDYREQATARGNQPHESPKETNWTKAFFELYADLPLAQRQARSFAYALENEPVYAFPLERLAGQTYQGCRGAGAPDLSGSEASERWNEFSVVGHFSKAVSEAFPPSQLYHRHFGGMGCPGHISWDFGMVLNLGIEGMQSRIAELRAEKAEDPVAVEFYDCASIALEGFLAWVRRHVETLKAMADNETDPQRRDELLQMAATCERVPARPAETFREAAQDDNTGFRVGGEFRTGNGCHAGRQTCGDSSRARACSSVRFGDKRYHGGNR